MCKVRFPFVCVVSAMLVACSNGSRGPAGAMGAPGAQGATGAPGAPGAAPDGGGVALQGTISGSVIATADNRALQGVTVSLSAAGALSGTSGTATTDASGRFSFPNLPISAYALAFARTGFLSKSVVVGNTTGGPTILAVTMDTDTTPGTDAPTFQISVSSSNGSSDPYAVGYGSTVTVSVTSIADPSEPSYDASAFSYAWTLGTALTLQNPMGAYSFDTPPTSTSATFTTMTLQQAKGIEVYPYANPVDGGPLGYFARLGVMGIDGDETGAYVVSLTISDPEGHNYSFTQPIQSTWQTASLADVPVGVPVYLQGDTFASPNWLQQGASFWQWPNTSWTWSFTSCSDPSNHAIACPALSDATTQFPSFVPPASGTYTLSVTETSSYANVGITGRGLDAGPGPAGSYGTQTSTLTVYAGNWVGVMNSSPAYGMECGSCHQPGGSGPAPDMFTPWRNTAHASALQRKMDGLADMTGAFNEGCMQCHTLGWSQAQTAQTALNGGFLYEMNTESGPDGGLWQYPPTNSPTSYSDMVASYPTLGYLGGIQCENCHGPAGGAAMAHPGSMMGASQQAMFRGARASWSEQVCASCHQTGGDPTCSKNYPEEWAETGHGNIQVAIQRATVESKAATYGGGADPQTGAQTCARCHSAQGFAHYVELLNHGATGRYDFLTTDDQKLGATNAPTTTWLSSIGLNAAEVQSQTCQTCHDPHGNGAYSAAYGSDAGIGPVDCTQEGNFGNSACMQLRIFDQLPYGLPNGIGPISGVGEGALCMACHNGRNGEHTDTVNTSPYAETPHDSTATEAMFGFDTFFVPRNNPSPHLAIQDTCTGCHAKLPTTSEVDAGQSTNHAFATDLSICKGCHGASVDGAGIQAQIANEMTSLAAAITTAVTAHVQNANSVGGLCVQVSGIGDPNCAGGSCKSSQIPTAVPFPVPPSNVWIPENGIASVTMSGADSTSVAIDVSAGIDIPYFDPQTLALVGTKVGAKTLSVAIYTILTGVPQATCSSGGTAGGGVVGNTANQLFPASNPSNLTPDPSIPSKAIWNWATLKGEGSGGIHNLPWTNAVISATSAQLARWKP